MVNIKELSEKRGNCFSCGNLRKFTPCGRFECRIHCPREGDAMLSDTNQPLETDCKHWIVKTKQRIMVLQIGETEERLMSIENEHEKPLPRYITVNFKPYCFLSTPHEEIPQAAFCLS